MDLCTKGDNIFVSDAQIGTVKLVTTVNGTVQSLENLGKFYGAFPFILKTDRLRGTHSQRHITWSKVCLHSLNSTVYSVQEIRNSDGTTNGPEGTVASKTVKSVQLVEKGLQKLLVDLREVNLHLEIDPTACLTLQAKSFHAVSHFKHSACTTLNYARDFGNVMYESLKRTSRWEAYYFTHGSSYNPMPENQISLNDIPKMSIQAPNEL